MASGLQQLEAAACAKSAAMWVLGVQLPCCKAIYSGVRSNMKNCLRHFFPPCFFFFKGTPAARQQKRRNLKQELCVDCTTKTKRMNSGSQVLSLGYFHLSGLKEPNMIWPTVSPSSWACQGQTVMVHLVAPAEIWVEFPDCQR